MSSVFHAAVYLANFLKFDHSLLQHVRITSTPLCYQRTDEYRVGRLETIEHPWACTKGVTRLLSNIKLNETVSVTCDGRDIYVGCLRAAFQQYPALYFKVSTKRGVMCLTTLLILRLHRVDGI